MPTIDYCQSQVVHALQKAGWTVAPKPQRLVVGRRVVYIDVVAKQSNQKVFIEVKCFADPGSVHEQYVAIGQYLTYQKMLAIRDNPTPLYLAIPSTIYSRRFDAIINGIIQDNHMKLLVIDLAMEMIVQWIE